MEKRRRKKIIFIAIKNSYFSKTKSDTSINVHVIVSTFAVSQWIRGSINYIEIFFSQKANEIIEVIFKMSKPLNCWFQMSDALQRAAKLIVNSSCCRSHGDNLAGLIQSSLSLNCGRPPHVGLGFTSSPTAGLKAILPAPCALFLFQNARTPCVPTWGHDYKGR